MKPRPRCLGAPADPSAQRLIACEARLLGDSSTVEQRTLTPLILVRIQVPQPTTFKSEAALEKSRFLGVGFERPLAPRSTFAGAQYQKRAIKSDPRPAQRSQTAPDSAADVSGGMAGMSHAPGLVLTAPYASAPRIAMAVRTAAA